MRVALLYPPDFMDSGCMPTSPFGSLPLLNGWMRGAGHEVLVQDLSALSFAHLCRRSTLEGIYAKLDHELSRALDHDDRNAVEQRRALQTARAIPKRVVLRAEEARERLRSGGYFRPDALRRDMRSLSAVMAMLSLARPRLDPRNENFKTGLYSYLEQSPWDPWVESYDTTVLPALREFRPDAIAFTIPFSLQLSTAMRFVQWLRAHFPHTPRIVGGTGVSDCEELLLGERRFYDWFDHVITGEAEQALPLLLERLAHGGSLDDVPALFRADGDRVVLPTRRGFADMNASPGPDCTGIDFSLYLVPERLVTLTTSRGCYYGKCTFCPATFRERFRRRGSSKAWADVRRLALEQGITSFMFWDPLTPPAFLREISEESRAEGIDIHWMAQVKFDEIYEDPEYVRTLAEGGCRHLQFGFESGVQRVLDDMEKGNDLARIDRILPLLKEHGISVGVFFFIGFPTELEEDAQETWRFLARRRHLIDLVGYSGTFGLGHDVPVFRNPERYDIDIVISERGDPTYKRRDGLDWDSSYLHAAFFARNDLYLIMSGVPVLYGKRFGPEMTRIVRDLTARWVAGPPVFLRPDVRKARLFVPALNGYHEWERPAPDGPSTEGIAYVSAAAHVHFLDEEERALVQAVRAGADAARLIDDAGERGLALRRRLARLLDLGILGWQPMADGEAVPERRDPGAAPTLLPPELRQAG